MTKYALHPGWIVSSNDGQPCYVSVAQLVQLYQLRPGEYIIWNGQAIHGAKWEDYAHLYPDHGGGYGRPRGNQ